MNWLISIGVGLCAAPVCGMISGTAAALCAEWMRVPNREGGAAYFALGFALLGALFGLIVGIAIARGLFNASPSFFKSLGLVTAACTAVSLVAMALVRVTADLPPKLDGQKLDLLVELRCPPGTTLPTPSDPSLAYVTFIRLADGESSGYASLNFESARDDAGRTIVPSTLRIETSAARKLLNIRLGEHTSLLFALDFKSKPRPEDFVWSRWIEAAHDVGQPRPESAAAFAVRYQVRKVEPPPPTPTREQQEADEDAQQEAAFRALAPDAPLALWLVYTRYGVPQPRIDAAVSAIRARPQFVAELAHEMLDGEYDSSRDALRVLEHMQPPPTELAEGVAAVGREIAETLRGLDPNPPAADQMYSYGSDISTRFAAWMVATRALQGKDGVDFTPVLKEIIEPARARQASHVIRIDVVRVASYYLQQWAGIEPLPTDPPPK